MKKIEFYSTLNKKSPLLTSLTVPRMESSYANAKFLIYRKGNIGGDLLLGSSMNEEEATAKINMLTQSYQEFNKQFPSKTKIEYCYIVNNPAWWKPVYG